MRHSLARHSPSLRLTAAALSSALVLAACGGSDDGGDQPGQPATRTASTEPPSDDAQGASEGESSTEASATASTDSEQATVEPRATLSADPLSARPRIVRTVATGLEVPWGVTFLPDGSALVGERDSTRVLRIAGREVIEVGRVPSAAPRGEAGLLGLAVSPGFTENPWLYAYVTTADDNRVVRMRYDDGRLGPPRPVLTGIPSGFIHDGGRLLFDRSGMLLVSTGEIGEPDLAQDRDSLAGKILRITPQGEPAPGNPTEGDPVWSLGHRNVQGLAFDGGGRLWASEFGSRTWDEVNLIEQGGNYGWPQVEGSGDQARFRNPAAVWRTEDASPSGLAYLDGSLWMGGLRGQRLWQIPLTDEGVGDPRPWFFQELGRIRTVIVTPDQRLWLTTSNRDGRGSPVDADDRIVEVALR